MLVALRKHRHAPARDLTGFLPTTREEMRARGFHELDILLINGDAYVDHPAFGAALIGRFLEARGFRVGMIAQPDWRTTADIERLGRPRLMVGITAGNLDSMLNKLTAQKKVRGQDQYSPGGATNRRPNRASIVYSNLARQAFPGVPIVLGGIEASLRRIAHYDYWSDSVRRSMLLDAKADLLIFGMGERPVWEVARRLNEGERIEQLRDVRGTAFALRKGEWEGLEASRYTTDGKTVILPSFEQASQSKAAFSAMSRAFQLETNPGNARPLLQPHGQEGVYFNPPAFPLETRDMDELYDLPFTRLPHWSYEESIPAYETVKHSIVTMRGCFGGCSFCSITEHEGRIIQNRSEESILREIEAVRDRTPGFTGIISDLGGPTANMWRLACKSREIEAACRKPSCVFPDVCDNLGTDHGPLVALYKKARALRGVKKVLIASGLRYDLAVRSPEYVRELAQHHTGGYLKIAPEHTESGPLTHMMKPGIGAYARFKELFDRYSAEAGKEQYLIPYFIAAHPGTTDEDMLNLALWLKQNRFRPDQVQAFLPGPMATATAMYHTGLNPLRSLKAREPVHSAKSLAQRRLHKAFLRYHDAENWPMLREALTRMGREELIGNGKHHLVPRWQPQGTGRRADGTRPAPAVRDARGPRKGAALTQHTGLPPMPHADRARGPKRRPTKGR